MTVPVGVVLSLLQAQKPAAAPRAKSVRNAARMKASPQAMTENKGPSASSQSNRRTGLGAVKNAQDSITHRAARRPDRPPSRGARAPSRRRGPRRERAPPPARAPAGPPAAPGRGAGLGDS